MDNILEIKVIEQKINGIPMEDYLAQLCEQIENDKIEKIKSDSIIAISKQINNRHKNIIDAQRVELKQKEFELGMFESKIQKTPNYDVITT